MTALLLSQFQNCAPAGGAGSQPGQSGEIRAIEDWNKAEIQFVAPEIQIHDEAEVTDISGLCNRSRNGAGLRWAIWAEQKMNAPMLTGYTRCGSGQFSVTLDELPNMVCGEKHLLVVEGDWGASTFTYVVRRCQPLAAEVVSSPEGSPQGTMCSIEYQPAIDNPDRCVQVCYRDNKMISSRPATMDQCSGLAAKLAGP